jgi:large subunit ribosomal protein L3
VAIEFLCRKIGMTQLFTESGECIPVTVLEAGPNRVVQKKTEEKDGYSALQLGYGERRPGRTPKGARGHFEKAGVGPQQVLKESRLSAEEAEAYEVGQEVKVDMFSEGQRVDVIGTSKGRGTAGVVKRHGFAIKRKTHGTHEFFRHGGSIGAGAYPGKVFKGMGMAGRMGNERVTSLNIEVVRVDADKGLLFVRGGVPGHPNGILRVRPSVKARAQA